MKKLLMILTAVLLGLAAAACAEEEAPRPEGGKKFEGCFAIGGGLIEINYEEEGYRVLVDLCNNDDFSGTIWEYSCYYHEDTDSLVSVSSHRRSYTTDPVTLERTDGEEAYGEFDEEGQETVFAFAQNGSLVWIDGRDKGAGADLEFRSIGRFRGAWRSAEGEEPVWAEFTWEGLNQETYYYFVYLHRGGDDVYTEYTMTGLYDEASGRLACTGGIAGEEGGETYDAFFSMNEDGTLLYEAANGIVLEYDPLGGSNG